MFCSSAPVSTAAARPHPAPPVARTAAALFGRRRPGWRRIEHTAGMRLTAFTDYSLRVLMFLAAHTGRRSTVAEIATAYDISQHHLVKVAHFLAQQGWVDTVRGKGGGLRLARPPEALGLGQVVRQTEGDARPAECFQARGNRCRISGCCQLKGVLASAVDAFYAVLDRHTLADITRNPRLLARALGIVAPPAHR